MIQPRLKNLPLRMLRSGTMKFWIPLVAAALFALTDVANAEYGHLGQDCGVAHARSLWDGYCDERACASHRPVFQRHFALGHGCGQGCAQGCGSACGPWDFARCGGICGCRPFQGLFRGLHGFGLGGHGCETPSCGCSDAGDASDAPDVPQPTPTPVALKSGINAPSTFEESAAVIVPSKRFGLWKAVHGQ